MPSRTARCCSPTAPSRSPASLRSTPSTPSPRRARCRTSSPRSAATATRPRPPSWRTAWSPSRHRCSTGPDRAWPPCPSPARHTGCPPSASMIWASSARNREPAGPGGVRSRTEASTVREHLLYIDGAWRAGRGGPMAAVSPASGETFASVAAGTPADVDDAVAAARAAWPAWAAASPFDRAACCEQIIAAIRARREELARALTQDQGKPLAAEAYDEVDELAEYFRMAGEDAKRREGGLPASTSAERRILATRVPLGVIAVVSPWNWPYTMGAELFGPAMAAGNTVVWVPAPTTSACCAVLAEVLAGTSLPAGVFNFVPGPGPVVGDALVAHPGVAGVGFVGSVETGGLVAARAAGKAQLLELGGNGPMVLLEDADLDLATEAALEAAYLCAGQS